MANSIHRHVADLPTPGTAPPPRTWSARSCGRTRRCRVGRPWAATENEVPAVPQLPDPLDLDGATVAVDAVGCRTQIAAKTVGNGGGYVLAAEDNQPTLHQTPRRHPDEMVLEKFKGVRHDSARGVEGATAPRTSAARVASP